MEKGRKGKRIIEFRHKIPTTRLGAPSFSSFSSRFRGKNVCEGNQVIATFSAEKKVLCFRRSIFYILAMYSYFLLFT
jgi:hypothetical protein